VIPVLASTRAGLATARSGLAGPVVLVPTMGALHDGHRALLRRARQISRPAGAVVVSIFVNPLQFGPAEDFGRYPRALDQDVAICGEEGAAVVFAPDRGHVYPVEPTVTVDPGPMGRLLEGRSRPGFFSGVLTVVLKLFQLVQPDAAVFGEKDAQQLALIRRMNADLDLGVEIVAEPTVRDPGGLAVSSRNAYLSGPERTTALALSRALAAGREHAQAGRAGILAAARAVLDGATTADPPLLPDYLALVDPVTFGDVADDDQGPAILLVAGTAGATRLIDNVPLLIGGPGAARPGHGR
jgi:pantoate--beta-alanine ligase